MKVQTIITLTRPLQESTRLAQNLKTKGISSLINPLLSLTPVNPSPQIPAPKDISAFLITSANALHFFPESVADYRNVPVYAIGRKTQKAAKEAGFFSVISAGGNAHDLIELFLSKRPRKQGVPVWLCGKHTHVNLSKELLNLGFQIAPIILYDSKCEAFFNERTLHVLKTGTSHGMVLFSQRTAQSCAKAVQKHGCTSWLKQTDVFCLGEAVAEPIQHLDWRHVHISPEPNEQALVELIVNTIT